ncbi:MAG: hypothetical protein ACRDPY_31865 [Streptosporangiaceae bacterium]
MSYQPYPSGGQPVESVRPAAPAPVLNAVKLMYVGAAISTISLIVALVDISGIKAAIKRDLPHDTTSQLNQAFKGFLILAIVSAAIGIGLWLWMAWANNRGKNWARITSTVLFGLETLSVLESFHGPKTALSLIFPVLTWLVGLGAIWLLWRRESTAFFKPQGLI